MNDRAERDTRRWSLSRCDKRYRVTISLRLDRVFVWDTADAHAYTVARNGGGKVSLPLRCEL
jgi:hypothetical protein